QVRLFQTTVHILNKLEKTSTLVTYTLTVDVLEQLLVINHLVDSTCQVQTLKQVDQTTLSITCKVKQLLNNYKYHVDLSSIVEERSFFSCKSIIKKSIIFFIHERFKIIEI